MPRLFPSRRHILITVLVAALIFVMGATLVAADPAPTVYYACVKGNGDIRIVQASEACKNNETKINWNQQGPAGPTGPAGPQGPQGPPGTGGSTATGTIIGYVAIYTAQLGPESGVHVYISGTSSTAVTQADGRFELDNVPVGPTWTITLATEQAGFGSISSCQGFILEVQLTQANQVLELPGYNAGPFVCTSIYPR